jgi:uncharacterized membrane protein
VGNRTRHHGASTSPPTERNVRVIAELERRALHNRTAADRLSDAITRITGTGAFAAVNLAVFAVWILANTVRVRGVEPFDPYPFNFLTLVVSLEAIFLSVFVLMSQARMTRAADKRARAGSAVDLLAENRKADGDAAGSLPRVAARSCRWTPQNSGKAAFSSILRSTRDVNKLASTAR